MKASIYLSDGGHLGFDDMDDATALDLRQDLDDGDTEFLTFDMDGATVLVARAHIVRVDLETGA